MFSPFDVEQAIKLIEQGYDGSEANYHALLKAKKTLIEASGKLYRFSFHNPDSYPGSYCQKESERLLSIANQFIPDRKDINHMIPLLEQIKKEFRQSTQDRILRKIQDYYKSLDWIGNHPYASLGNIAEFHNLVNILRDYVNSLDLRDSIYSLMMKGY